MRCSNCFKLHLIARATWWVMRPMNTMDACCMSSKRQNQITNANGRYIFERVRRIVHNGENRYAALCRSFWVTFGSMRLKWESRTNQLRCEIHGTCNIAVGRYAWEESINVVTVSRIVTSCAYNRNQIFRLAFDDQVYDDSIALLFVCIQRLLLFFLPSHTNRFHMKFSFLTVYMPFEWWPCVPRSGPNAK